jgi:hypothetical protein
VSTVTPDDIAVALGRTAPAVDSAEYAQWSMWITDAEMLIETRRVTVDSTLALDESKVDYVVREAVVAQVRRPDDATQVSTSVDDTSVQRTYKSSRGRVSIIDEWWTLLGLTAARTGAFSFRPYGGAGAHQPWCSLAFGAIYCSCGADLTNYDYPLYEY